MKNYYLVIKYHGSRCKGVGVALKKSERRVALVEYLSLNPFATDEQLAEKYGVSVPTIRLDRAALQIPEVRERIRLVAEDRHDAVRAMEEREVIGEVLELQLNRFAVSVYEPAPSHAFAKSGIVRGHFLFAQVNSLAAAVMDADLVVTAKSELRFLRPVHLGEVLHARVDVVALRKKVAKCRVVTEAHGDKVLEGFIWVMAVDQPHQALAVGTSKSLADGGEPHEDRR
ncbi:MAG: transcription factor FapR [Alicyclobacillus sp.]|nr:transcription factor FapR [Alicyclobacillus sp.]